MVFDVIKELEGETGAPWDSIVAKCSALGLDENTIEEALTSLMDKGFIYEPVLGTIKST
jgi:DNA replicative helicase MCM subunit Mcm2 (Cdc46/Mcm family)